jgi:hypothetical protein
MCPSSSIKAKGMKAMLNASASNGDEMSYSGHGYFN